MAVTFFLGHPVKEAKNVVSGHFKQYENFKISKSFRVMESSNNKPVSLKHIT